MSRSRSPVTTTLLRQRNLRTFGRAFSSRSPLARSLLLSLQDGSNGGQRWKQRSFSHGWRRGRCIFFSRADGVRRFIAREDGWRARGRAILPRGGAPRDDRRLFPRMKTSPLSWPCLQRGEKVSVVFRRGGVMAEKGCAQARGGRSLAAWSRSILSRDWTRISSLRFVKEPLFCHSH
jgi:hypothetical protein